MASSKLFVGNLRWKTQAETLRGLFEEYGPVEKASIIYDRDTGRSRGFGFVTFQNAEDAKTAMEKLNAYKLDGKSIKVSYPTPTG